MYTIHVVEDETDLSRVIRMYLEKEGYQVQTFSDGQAALDAVASPVHLWLLDIMLGSDISGYDIIQSIQANNPVPVIFMSARDQELDRIMGLELGSDDYITKPFSMRELVLRVNNVIKRVYGDSGIRRMQCGPYTVDVSGRMILMEDTPITLTSKEMDMALYFLSNRNVSLTRDQLLDHVWGSNYYGSDRVVDDLVKRLRKKLPEIKIETIYGYGYRLKV